MSDERLDRELRSIAVALVADPPDVPSWDQLVVDPGSRPRSTPRPSAAIQTRRWPGPVVAVGAMLLVLVVIGGFNFATRFGGSSDPGIEAGGDSVESTSSAPPKLDPLALGVFEQLAGADDAFGVEPVSIEPDSEGVVYAAVDVNAAAVGPRGVVAVGSVNGRFNSVGAIWYSPDGHDWERIAHDDVLFGDLSTDANTLIIDVAAGNDGFVAVGKFTGDHTKYLWTSSDGRSWTRNPIDFDAVAVAAAGPAWVAVGSKDDGAGVWTSPDGVTWAQSESPAFQSVSHRLFIFDVATDGRTIVAVGGSDARDHREERPIIWVSRDGLEWSRMVDDEGTFDIPVGDGISEVVAGPSGFVAVGQERIAEGGNPGYAAVWSSPDGLTWQRHRLGTESEGFPAWVTAGPEGYVLFANGWRPDGVFAALWTSRDGITWEIHDAPEITALLQGAAMFIDHQLLLFGTHPAAETEPSSDTGHRPGTIWSANL